LQRTLERHSRRETKLKNSNQPKETAPDGRKPRGEVIAKKTQKVKGHIPVHTGFYPLTNTRRGKKKRGESGFERGGGSEAQLGGEEPFLL